MHIQLCGTTENVGAPVKLFWPFGVRTRIVRERGCVLGAICTSNVPSEFGKTPLTVMAGSLTPGLAGSINCTAVMVLRHAAEIGQNRL
jgi:hypothetical protein